MASIFNKAEIDTVTLDHIVTAICQDVSRDGILAMRPELLLAEIADRLRVTMRLHLLGKQETRWEDVRWPQTWWQMLKAQYAPQWALRRWPIRYESKRIQVDYQAVCPHLPFDSRMEHVRFPVLTMRAWDKKEEMGD